ncbi:hypothetical protein ACTOV4_10975 [Brucella sp. C7-11G]
MTTPDTAVQTSSGGRSVPPAPARRPRDRPLSALAPSLGAPSGHCPHHRHRGHGASVGLAVDPINAIANDPADEERDT